MSKTLWMGSLALILGVIVFSASAETQTVATTGPQLQFSCTNAKEAAIDPMFDPPEAHDHWFAGNTQVRANSTSTSLRSSGGTTCKKRSDTSTYWKPLLYEADGAKRLQVVNVTIYYQGLGNQKDIRMIPAATNLFSKNTDWRCGVNGIPQIEPPVGCDDTLRFRVDFPECFDGTSARNPDAFVEIVGGRCPTTHPEQLPSIRAAFHLVNDDTLEGPVLVSAGAGMLHDYTFAHGNFMNGAQPGFKDIVRRCVTKVADGQRSPVGCRPAAAV